MVKIFLVLENGIVKKVYKNNRNLAEKYKKENKIKTNKIDILCFELLIVFNEITIAKLGEDIQEVFRNRESAEIFFESFDNIKFETYKINKKY